MKELHIYEDRECETPVDKVLYEGRTYYVLFPTDDADLIHIAIHDANLTEHISWHRLNLVATLQLVNHIGYLYFFGKVYDVRTEKFMEDIEGERQFAALLDDLTCISREIIFDYAASTKAERIHNSNEHNPSLLERFNYYRQWFLSRPQGLNFEDLMSSIFKNPHTRLITEHVDDFVWNVRKPTQQTLRSLFQHPQNLCELPANHVLASVNGRGLRSSDGTRTFFPLRAASARNRVTLDTTENRFIKYVLQDIENVCTSIQAKFGLPTQVYKTATLVIGKVRSLLSLDFFSTINTLRFFPSSSPTLATRHGYREIYTIFLRGRIGATHLFEELQQESLFIDLKDVALLYEYWVFYNVVRSLFGTHALVTYRDLIVKDGRLVYSAQLENEKFIVCFNRSFNRSSNESYSLTFRPDISIELKTKSEKYVIVLDAKYKNIEGSARVIVEEEDTLLKSRVVKSEDIHKMHCYIDAIAGAKTAIAVYPGTDFIFYPHLLTHPIAKSVSTLNFTEGVGAVPLMPGNPGLNLQFDQLMEKIQNLAK